MHDPVLLAYSVRKAKSGKTIWTRIGAAYPHETGAGLTIVLDARPIGDKIVLLEPRDI